MKKTALSLLLLAAAAAQAAPAPSATSATDASCVRLSSEQLLDKIKGGWAGQTIGVVYGAPVEFKFTGSYTQAYQPIPWNEHIVKYWWDKKPGLFDDIYNDCTFVETFEQLGLDVSQEELRRASMLKLRKAPLGQPTSLFHLRWRNSQQAIQSVGWIS